MTTTNNTSITAVFSKTKKSYTITWKNYDGTILETDTSVLYGTIPEYNQANDPVKTNTTEYKYSFKGWNKTVSSVTKDETYTATFNEIKQVYTITISSNNSTYGTTTQQSVINVPYGSVISVLNNTISFNSITITANSTVTTAQYSYTFIEWKVNDETFSSGMTTSDSTTISAIFSRTTNNYVVTWKNYDGTILEIDNVEYGTIPEYNSTTPIKTGVTDYVFTFSGWTPSVSTITENVEFIAQYIQKCKTIITDDTQISSEDSNGVSAKINSENGFDSNMVLKVTVITNTMTESGLIIPSDKDVINYYNATLYVNEEEVNASGDITIRLKIATQIPAADVYYVYINENNKTVTKTASIDGDYLVFTCTELGNFAIVGENNKTTSVFLWFDIVMGVIVLLELVVIGALMRRNKDDESRTTNAKNNKKKSKKGVRAASFVPLWTIIAVAGSFSIDKIIAIILSVCAIGLALVILKQSMKTYNYNQYLIELSKQGQTVKPEVTNADKDQDKIAEEELFKELIAAATQTAVHNPKISKKKVADYMIKEYGRKIIVRRKDNYTSTNLPLADTHFAVLKDKVVCFAFVYELNGGEMFMLLRASDDSVKKIKKVHKNIKPSKFPKSTVQWYSLIIDNSFKNCDSVGKVLKLIYLDTKKDKPKAK